MATKRQKQQKIEHLRSYLGQLIDLKQGLKDEIVIKRGDDAELLMEAIQRAIDFENMPVIENE